MLYKFEMEDISVILIPKLVYKVVVLTLCADSLRALPDSPDLLFYRRVHNFASQVTGFNRMTVEVQVLSDRDLSDLIIPKFLKTRKSIFLQSLSLHLEGILCIMQSLVIPLWKADTFFPTSSLIWIIICS